jgi:hypothetical protein
VRHTLNEAESAFRQLHERYDHALSAALGVPCYPCCDGGGVRRQHAAAPPADREGVAAIEIEVLLRESRDGGVALDETTLMVR